LAASVDRLGHVIHSDLQRCRGLTLSLQQTINMDIHFVAVVIIDKFTVRI